jgi:hypothetical protein
VSKRVSPSPCFSISYGLMKTCKPQHLTVKCRCTRSLSEVGKVKESRNRPGVAQRLPGGLDSQISLHSAREGGEVSLTHRPPLPSGNVPGTHFH